MKKALVLVAMAVMLMSGTASAINRSPVPKPNATAPVQLPLLSVETDRFTTALDITGVLPDAPGGTVHINASNCSGFGTAPGLPSTAFDLAAGQIKHFEAFGASQCNVVNYGVTTATVSGGTVTLHSAAVYTDTATGQKSRIDVPSISDALPTTPGAYADVERLANGIDGRSQYFGLFAKDTPTTVTFTVFDDKGKIIGVESTLAEKSTFYGLKSKTSFGSAKITNGANCNGCDAKGEVYIVQFDGYTNGGSPRVYLPPIRRPTAP